MFLYFGGWIYSSLALELAPCSQGVTVPGYLLRATSIQQGLSLWLKLNIHLASMSFGNSLKKHFVFFVFLFFFLRGLVKWNPVCVLHRIHPNTQGTPMLISGVCECVINKAIFFFSTFLLKPHMLWPPQTYKYLFPQSNKTAMPCLDFFLPVSWSEEADPACLGRMPGKCSLTFIVSSLKDHNTVMSGVKYLKDSCIIHGVKFIVVDVRRASQVPDTLSCFKYSATLWLFCLVLFCFSHLEGH